VRGSPAERRRRCRQSPHRPETRLLAHLRRRGVIARVLAVRSRLQRRKPRTAVILLPPSPSMDRPGSDGSYAEWPLRQGRRRACGRRRCAPLTQTALDGAGAHLLAIWPELTVEALGVTNSIYRTALALLFAAPLAVRSRGQAPYVPAPTPGVVLLSL
jgi:hypothetical protein